MGTRANIFIFNSEQLGDIILYKHCDGSPDSVLEDLSALKKHCTKQFQEDSNWLKYSSKVATELVRLNQSIQISGCLSSFSKYIYFVDIKDENWKIDIKKLTYEETYFLEVFEEE